jgi:L-cysteine S-thiosulfotransferase
MQLRQTHFVLAAAIGGILGALMLAPAPALAASPDAKKLVAANCEQCHEVKGITDFGNVGPSLIGLKDRYPDRKDVVAIINDETKRNAQTVMPPFGRNLILTNEEIGAIVDYLYKQ